MILMVISRMWSWCKVVASSRAKRLGSDLMGVESKKLRAEVCGVKVQEIDDLRACDASCDGRRVGVISTYQGFGFSTVFFRWRKR